MDAILAEVARLRARYVTVTGGEPLAQKGCLALLSSLCDADLQVSLETSGALDIAAVDPRVMLVMDLKTPGSGEVAHNLWSNIPHLKPIDQIKFVICDRQDYDWSRNLLREHNLEQVCEVLFSPSYGQLPARELADWVVADNLPVRFQLQLHKILWGEEHGR